jgi:hypothetical protein
MKLPSKSTGRGCAPDRSSPILSGSRAPLHESRRRDA